ncbi:MAG: hypothetical protein IT374_17765 [Polyangiaceae bacterium]|nr:hypothetical protein [Polyangiaceae bacterium]
MPRRLISLSLFALASLSLFGCAKGPEKRLTGKWVGERIDNIPPGQEARANGWVRATTMEIKGDKLTVIIPGAEPRSGAFKVEKVNGNKVTVGVTRDSGERDEAVLTMAGDDLLKWDVGNERVVTFTRVASR